MKLYLARDANSDLHLYRNKPSWSRTWHEFVPELECKLRLPDDYIELPPGQCVELETAKPAVVLDGELLRVMELLMEGLDEYWVTVEANVVAKATSIIAQARKGAAQ